MKRNLHFLRTAFAWILVLSVVSNQSIAQTAASATWSLLTNQTALVDGDISATNQTIGSAIAGIATDSWYQANTSKGWQKIGTTTALPIGFDANSYVQYQVSPANSQYLQVNSVSLGMAGANTGIARVAAVYSFDNFATSFSLANTAAAYKSQTYQATQADPVVLVNAENPPAGLDAQSVLTFSNLAINVSPGQTLSVRFYVWATTTTGKILASKNVVIAGKTDANLIPLPLDFLAFNASLKINLKKEVLLNWTTTNEINTKSFIIERGVDGTLSPIGNEVSAKNINGVNHYLFIDENPLQGTSFYRLTQVDLDGTKNVYNKIVSIKNDNLLQMAVFPNPVISQLNITLPEAVAGSTIRVVGSNGRNLLKKTIQEGTANLNLDVASLASGYYVVIFESNLKSYSAKFIKE